eukprot:TRINITY_DN7977_c0_g1_i1.p1 TRINITY_DN7977_c0_g1~~TRINITY_DN7977_c0_g1_i1.p1  ORF type:complete len:517 (+),score=50.47 TRINITY_DN7977_c0_g1_i1:64-1614(+)
MLFSGESASPHGSDRCSNRTPSSSSVTPHEIHAPRASFSRWLVTGKQNRNVLTFGTLESRPFSRQASASAESPLLLGTLDDSVDQGSVIEAISVDSMGEHQVYRAKSLTLLARKLWHTEDSLLEKCEMLRLLMDPGSRFVVKLTVHCFVVLTESLQCLLEPERAIFIGPPPPVLNRFLDEFSESVRRRLANDVSMSLSMASCASSRIAQRFDIWAVECILCAAVMIHYMRVQALQRVVTSAMTNAKLGSSRTALKQLYPLNSAMSGLIDRLSLLVKCMNEVSRKGLSRESSGDFTSLTEERPLCTDKVPWGAADDTTAEAKAWMDESVGDLLDAVDRWRLRAEDIMEELVGVHQSVEQATTFTHASLDCFRNHLLEIDLGATVLSTTAGFGSMVAGIFGMNLTIGWEERYRPYPFLIVVAFIIIVGYIAVRYAFRYYKKSVSGYSLGRQHFGRNVFFQNILDDSYVLTLEMNEGKLSEEALAHVMSDLESPALLIGSGAPNPLLASTPERAAQDHF